MEEEFRGRANEEFARLVTHWRQIEMWLKRAEQVNQNAIIPAINELRYASRQMINATIRLSLPTLNEIDRSHIQKRLTIAEQYLINADHDVSDSITTFYSGVVRKLDNEVGQTLVVDYFPEYVRFKSKLNEACALIVDSRHSYDDRKANYDKLKCDHLPYLIESFRTLQDAEVMARHQQARTANEILRAQAKIGILTFTTYIGTIAAVVAIPMMIYFWAYARTDICAAHRQDFVSGIFCDQTTSGPSKQETPPIKSGTKN